MRIRKDWIYAPMIAVIIIIVAMFLPNSNITGDTASNLTNNSYLQNYDQIKKALVKVGFFAPSENDIVYVGTGFFVDRRGYILTAKHNYQHWAGEFGIDMVQLIDDLGYVEIGNQSYKVKRIEDNRSERKDVLILKTEQSFKGEFSGVSIASKEEVSSIGEKVSFMGYTSLDDSGMKLFTHQGTISNIYLTLNEFTEPVYSVYTLSVGGFSGAPVFLDSNGKVIGIIKGGDSPKGIVIVPPIHEIPELLKQLK